MKILQVLRGPVGGVLRHVNDLSLFLAQAGHEVGIVADTRNVNEQSQMILDALEPSMKLGIHRLSMPRTFGFDDFRALSHIKALLDDLDIDIVHGHGAKGGFYARLANCWSSSKLRKAFYTPHGGTLHYSKSSPAGFLFLAMESWLTGMTDTLIFESAYSQKIFTEKAGSPKCPELVIHNGLSEADFEAADLSAPTHDFLFIGELRMIKGVDILLRALVNVSNSDGKPATLYCVGAGPDQDYFHGLVKELGLEERVDFPGAMPARQAFHRGKGIIVCSRNEALPYIVLEASAAQIPMIATDVGGIAEIFGPTAEHLIEAENSDALSQALQNMLDHYGKAQEQAQERLEHVLKDFHVTPMCESILALYEA